MSLQQLRQTYYIYIYALHVQTLPIHHVFFVKTYSALTATVTVKFSYYDIILRKQILLIAMKYLFVQISDPLNKMKHW